MEDSFFGFNTSAPVEDDGGGRIAEPSEEEYDALNDETFGSAINGDWEEVHESLVRLTVNHNGDFNRDNAAGAACLRDTSCGGAIGLFETNHPQSPESSSSATTPVHHTRSTRNKNEVDSDLEFNLAGMKLDDVDITFDDDDSIMDNSGISMDSSVWASAPEKLQSNNLAPDHTHSMLYPSPFQQQRENQQKRFANETPSFIDITEMQKTPKGHKICTVEDIERSIITQQAMLKQNRKQPSHEQSTSNMKKETHKSPIPTQTQQQQKIQTNKLQPIQTKGPPGFNQLPAPPRPTNIFANNIAKHPLGNLLQQQHHANVTGSHRMPPGFSAMPIYQGLGPHLHPPNHAPLPPHPLFNQHTLPPNFPHPHQRPLPSPHLPIALNNFAMHPSFNAMRAAAAASSAIYPTALVPPPIQPPRLPPHPGAAGIVPPNAMFNMFNMRLMQEIQQNHPLLQNMGRQIPHMAAASNMLNMHLQHNQYQQRGAGMGKQQQQQNHYQHNRRCDGGGANGNLPPEEFDEYANLMSTRDKHWLIGIQLSQLNTDTPYIDDFYYTVYTERKAHVNGGDIRQSKTHKDNQLNHPLTQPKGHAQLILVQLGNKNGTRNNGQNRERRNSESGGQEASAKPAYVFTPMKFENSLGKLQYGSVTAPRKIIDADIMGSEGGVNAVAEPRSSNAADSLLLSISKAGPVGGGASIAAGGGAVSEITSTQRKSRHILLHIETLFRIVLKLEDLDNPNAIATIIMKKKKETERILALEQLENANKSCEERAASDLNNPQQPSNAAMKSRFAYEIETKEELISKLNAGLSREKVIAMMNVRKGKALLRRVMPHLLNHESRWNVWVGVFASLQSVVKKDRDDAEGILYALYPELRKQVQMADFGTVVKLASAIPLNEKKSSGVFCSKFGISAVVCLILQAESLYTAAATDDDEMLNSVHRNTWRQFLDQVATSLNRTIQSQSICAAIESDSIQPMMDHFARFNDLKLDSLLALITEAKQQIN